MTTARPASPKPNRRVTRVKSVTAPPPSLMGLLETPEETQRGPEETQHEHKAKTLSPQNNVENDVMDLNAQHVSVANGVRLFEEGEDQVT